MSRRLLIARPGHIYLATYSSTSATISIDLDLPFAGNPSWFAVSPTKSNLLYTFDENGSATYLFDLNLSSNTLAKVAERHDGSKGVCHLGFNKQGTIMLGTSWAAGTIDIWNTESPSPQLIQTIDSKDPVIDAGREARAHQAVVDPTGRFFVVNDLGTDSLLVLDALRPDVPVVRRVTVASGSGPRHGVFYPEGDAPATHYLLLCETSNRVLVFALEYTEGDIEFTAAGDYSTFLEEEGSSERSAFAAAGEIVLSKDGGHVYTSNRLTTSPTETIAHFRVVAGAEGGLSLELVAETSTQGKHPRMFSLSRDGNELFVANQEGEWAVVVLRRREDGTLEEQPVAGLLMEDVVQGEGDQRGPMFVLEVV